jgi:DNA polymerase-3 subunit epsilon
MTLNFTAIDVETANYSRASICSVGLCKVRDGQIVLSTSWLVDPPGGRTFERINIGKHGITSADLKDARSWVDSLSAILDFADGDDFAHHSMFDRQAIEQACVLSGLEVPALNSIDTQALAEALLPIERFTLKDVARSLALPPFKHHNAEEDAVTCARVLIELARSQGGLDEPFSSTPIAKAGASGSVCSRARTSAELHPWIRQKIDENPYSEDNHNAWLDFVLAHPDGRATEGTPCIGCGSPIDQKTHHKYKDRHCCVACSEKLKKRAKKYAASIAPAKTHENGH